MLQATGNKILLSHAAQLASARGRAHLSASARSFRSCSFWFAMLSCCTKRWVSSNSACLAACRAWLQVAGVACYTGKEQRKKKGARGYVLSFLVPHHGLAEVRVKVKPTKKEAGAQRREHCGLQLAFNLRLKRCFLPRQPFRLTWYVFTSSH